MAVKDILVDPPSQQFGWETTRMKVVSSSSLLSQQYSFVVAPAAGQPDNPSGFHVSTLNEAQLCFSETTTRAG